MRVTLVLKENKSSRREDAPGRRDSHVRREDGSSRKEERWQKRDEKSAERAQAGTETKESAATKRHGKEKPSDHYKGHGPAQGPAYGEGRPGNHATKRFPKGTRREKESHHRDQVKSTPAPQVVNQDHEIEPLKESLSLSQVEVRQLKSQLAELKKGLDMEKAQVVTYKDEIEKFNAEIEKLKEVTPSAEKDTQTEPIPLPETTSVSVQTVPPPPPPEVKAPTKPEEVKLTVSESKNTPTKVSSIAIDEGSGSDWADYDTDEDDVSGDEYEGIDVLNEKLKTEDGGPPPPQQVPQGHKLPQIKLAGDPSGEVMQIARGGPSRGTRDLRELITPRPDGRRMDSGREAYGDGFRGRTSADPRAFKKDGTRYQDNSSQGAKNSHKGGDVVHLRSVLEEQTIQSTSHGANGIRKLHAGDIEAFAVGETHMLSACSEDLPTSPCWTGQQHPAVRFCGFQGKRTGERRALAIGVVFERPMLFSGPAG
ncbi:hypothetical protein NDN08_003582 [Rhodosorus marinus]|uniref:Uncharacterized protein n=1 Tax=Rhodosorus marinus TaxID=101924 RepID=A0AAV8UWY1_9RHOD|nr:hypothetical protein NDN08_003582 [Rhodosorus marinus]